MIVANRKLRLVVLDYPVYFFNDPLVSKLFSAIVDIKIQSYSSTYGEVMPFDKSDFFGTHFIICEEKDNELIALSAFKSVTLDRCEKYHFEFPALSLLRADASKSSYDALYSFIQEHKDKEMFSYGSAWASALSHRYSDDLALNLSLLEMVMMICVINHQENNIKHMVTCGAKRVKTTKFFERMGLSKVHPEAEFKQKSLSSEDAIMYRGAEFSFLAHSMAKKYRQLWDERLILDGSLLNKAKVGIAA